VKQTQERQGNRRSRDGGLGGEEEGESGRAAATILISGNWPPRELKLGDGRQEREEREEREERGTITASF